MQHLSPVGRLLELGTFSARHTGGTRGPGRGDEGPGGGTFGSGDYGPSSLDGGSDWGEAAYQFSETEAKNKFYNALSRAARNIGSSIADFFSDLFSGSNNPNEEIRELERDLESSLGTGIRLASFKGKKVGGFRLNDDGTMQVRADGQWTDIGKLPRIGGGRPRGGGFTYQGTFYPYPAHVDSAADRRQFRTQIENQVGGSAQVQAAPADKVWSWLNPKQQSRSWNQTVHIKKGGNKYAIKNGVITVELKNGKWKQVGTVPKPDTSDKRGNKPQPSIQGNMIVLPNGRKIRDNKKNRRRHGLPLN